MKKYILLFLCMTSYCFAQSVNDYRYVIVPSKFSFQKEENQNQLNSLTKLMLEKYGFVVFMSNDNNIPEELLNKRCSFLIAEVIDVKGILNTKLKVQLKDCKEQLVFETEVGSSKEKDLQIARVQALRNASVSFDRLNYKYNGKNDIQISITNTPEVQTESLVEQNQNINNTEVFFFAQPIANGFQIVNNEPRVIMRLFNTSQKNVYIALKDDIHGVVLNKNGKWVFEFYESGKLTSETINLRF